MANKVLKELAIAVSSYEDRNTGQTKNRYENIGVLMQSENDRGERNTYIMLKRSFNPAGVPFKQGSDKILISLFDPREQNGAGNRQDDARSQDAGGYDDRNPDMPDATDIPF